MRAVYRSTTLVAMRAPNLRLFQEAAARVRGCGEQAVYLLFVDEIPGLFFPPKTGPSREAQRGAGRRAWTSSARRTSWPSRSGAWPTTPAPRWPAPPAGWGSSAVLVGTSQRSAVWHLLRGNVLRSLVAELPNDTRVWICNWITACSSCAGAPLDEVAGREQVPGRTDPAGDGQGGGGHGNLSLPGRDCPAAAELRDELVEVAGAVELQLGDAALAVTAGLRPRACPDAPPATASRIRPSDASSSGSETPVASRLSRVIASPWPIVLMSPRRLVRLRGRGEPGQRRAPLRPRAAPGAGARSCATGLGTRSLVVSPARARARLHTGGGQQQRAAVSQRHREPHVGFADTHGASRTHARREEAHQPPSSSRRTTAPSGSPRAMAWSNVAGWRSSAGRPGATR